MNSPKQATLDYPIPQLFARRWRPYAFADRPVSDDDLQFDEDDSSGADPGRGSLMDRSDRTGRANQKRSGQPSRNVPLALPAPPAAASGYLRN
jgi:hypothetical protein